LILGGRDSTAKTPAKSAQYRSLDNRQRLLLKAGFTKRTPNTELIG
jgi:hypothetical protein